jgi:glycosyltransferase involved in cell wall biosynthesis
MKILLICWFFPPTNTIGAVRLGHLGRYLLKRGHDVQVLSAVISDIYPQTLNIEFAAPRLHRTPWFDVGGVPQRLARLVRRGGGKVPTASTAGMPTAGAAAGDAPTPPAPGMLRRMVQGAAEFYHQAVNVPDRQVGWLPFAVREGNRLLAGWRPDVIFSSGPPFTTLAIGHRLAGRHDVAHVVEFRDRWSDDPYGPPPGWRGRIDAWLESRIVARAAGITTVSEPWAETYRQRYGKPVAAIYNGYDPVAASAAAPTGATGRPDLVIRYMGIIYPGRRDPSPLFAALARMGEEAARVRIEFFGTQPEEVWPLAERYGVRPSVEVSAAVTHAESLRLQAEADVLLLMQWNDRREQGNVPGKFFEYLGARRPILGLGIEDGVPARICRERGAGVFANDPDAIALHLRAWLTTKSATGAVPPLPDSARAGFARDEQWQKLETFLGSLIRPSPGAAEPAPDAVDTARWSRDPIGGPR